MLRLHQEELRTKLSSLANTGRTIAREEPQAPLILAEVLGVIATQW